MTLSQKQALFCQNVALLIQFINSQEGYRCRFDEAFRPKWVAEVYQREGKGSINSLHIDRLAIDLIVDINGVYREDTEAYRFAGTYWKSLHPLNRWGGDFPSDGNHFSMEHEGRK